MWDGSFETVGHASASVWAGSDEPDGQAVGGSWLALEFSDPVSVVGVRLAQGSEKFRRNYQAAQNVWLECEVGGVWEKLADLTFTAPDSTCYLKMAPKKEPPPPPPPPQQQPEPPKVPAMICRPTGSRTLTLTLTLCNFLTLTLTSTV